MQESLLQAVGAFACGQPWNAAARTVYPWFSPGPAWSAAVATPGCQLELGDSPERWSLTITLSAYLVATQQLVRGTAGRFLLLAEGRFLAEQIKYQIGVEVSWIPPLALYAEQRWLGAHRRDALVLRSRFFVTMMGELLRSLLREIQSINGLGATVTFLGVDNQFDEQWLTLEQIASYAAVVLYPNDVHQRTFHEVYKMAVPLLMPDEMGLYRAQRAANWGYASYGGRIRALGGSDSAWQTNVVEPWWDSFHAAPKGAPLHFQRMADWEQFPHVLRFASLPGLLDLLHTTDLVAVSEQMRDFHHRLTDSALRVVSGRVLGLLQPLLPHSL